MDTTGEIEEDIVSPSPEKLDVPVEFEEEIQEDDNLYDMDKDWDSALAKTNQSKDPGSTQEAEEVLEDMTKPETKEFAKPVSPDILSEKLLRNEEDIVSDSINGLKSLVDDEMVEEAVMETKVLQEVSITKPEIVDDFEDIGKNANSTGQGLLIMENASEPVILNPPEDKHSEIKELVGKSSTMESEIPTEPSSDQTSDSLQNATTDEIRENAKKLRDKRDRAKQRIKAVPPATLPGNDDEPDNEGISSESKMSAATHDDSQINTKSKNATKGGGHPGKIRGIVKDHQKDSDYEKSDWNDSIAPVPNPSSKERHSIVEQRRQERIAQRARRLSAESAEPANSAANGVSVDDMSSIEGSASSIHPSASKPSRSRSYNAKHRVRRPVPVGSSEEGDPSRLVLPPIIAAHQPKTSPSDHPRAALASLLRESTVDDDLQNESDNGRFKRHRKPLYLRMIEKAQKQYIDDERLKHEKYVQERKLKQRSNPTPEELREHRRKHDLLVKAKLEEGRKNIAESVMNNARAVKRQQDVASVVQAAIESGGSAADLLVDGASPLRKRKGPAKQPSIAVNSPTNGKREGKGSSDSRRAAVGRSGSKANVLEDHGFSPMKSGTRRDHDVEEGGIFRKDSPVLAIPISFDDKVCDSDKKDDSEKELRRVALEFDRNAAAAAVEKIPPLSSQAIPTYCAADWIDRLAAVEIDSADMMAVPFNLPAGSDSRVASLQS